MFDRVKIFFLEKWDFVSSYSNFTKKLKNPPRSCYNKFLKYVDFVTSFVNYPDFNKDIENALQSCYNKFVDFVRTFVSYQKFFSIVLQQIFRDLNFRVKTKSSTVRLIASLNPGKKPYHCLILYLQIIVIKVRIYRTAPYRLGKYSIFSLYQKRFVRLKF